ncbi:hypothetical protein [Komagataeibacter xylinus]|uniref:Uncharacterized protein n=1 Tax=Komagataeibacter xylinus TaxID=28448 RepID=A0A857FKJ2_KOMXY|nr:hypothetical protein [Komagataeibacter xylinus]QHC34701.1 hypothetical protein FMA36_03520 [Komagataeibacter xylinus]
MISGTAQAADLCPDARAAYTQLTGPYGGVPSVPPVADLPCPQQVQAMRILPECVGNAPAPASGAFDQNAAMMECDSHLRKDVMSSGVAGH